MKKISIVRSLLSCSVIWILNLQSSVYGNSCAEGSGTKKHHEGSGTINMKVVAIIIIIMKEVPSLIKKGLIQKRIQKAVEAIWMKKR